MVTANRLSVTNFRSSILKQKMVFTFFMLVRTRYRPYGRVQSGVLGLALDLQLYDFRITRDHVLLRIAPSLKPSTQKTSLLNEGIRAWMAAQDQPHGKTCIPLRGYHVETPFNGTLVGRIVGARESARRICVVGRKCRAS